MTLPYEEYNSLRSARRFLYDLLDPKKTPRVPKAIRKEAHRITKHFPLDFSLDQRYNDVVYEDVLMRNQQYLLEIKQLREQLKEKQTRNA